MLMALSAGTAALKALTGFPLTWKVGELIWSGSHGI